jgi:DNA gyrase inhibitor GyrI
MLGFAMWRDVDSRAPESIASAVYAGMPSETEPGADRCDHRWSLEAPPVNVDRSGFRISPTGTGRTSVKRVSSTTGSSACYQRRTSFGRDTPP